MPCWAAPLATNSITIWDKNHPQPRPAGKLLRAMADPYTVAGILARTATPVDRASSSVYITLRGDEAMHLGCSGNGAPCSPRFLNPRSTNLTCRSSDRQRPAAQQITREHAFP